MNTINKQKLFSACHDYESAYTKFCFKEREYVRKIEEIERLREEFKLAELGLSHAINSLKLAMEEEKL